MEVVSSEIRVELLNLAQCHLPKLWLLLVWGGHQRPGLPRPSNLPHTLVPVASWEDTLDAGDGGVRGAGWGSNLEPRLLCWMYVARHLASVSLSFFFCEMR